MLAPAPESPAFENPRPDVIVVEGDTNILAIARSLARQGVRTYAITHPGARARWSRHCRWIGPGVAGDTPEAWLRYLLSDRCAAFSGHILWAGGDRAVRMIAQHREALGRRYRLDLSRPKAQLAMLDKLDTYDIATRAGVPTPRYWPIADRDAFESALEEVTYPVVIKPLFCHELRVTFHAKILIAHDPRELQRKFDATQAAGIDVMLVEYIPGGDDRLSSYYTYIDEDGDARFDLTKRTLRRFPPVQGEGCDHTTTYEPDLHAPAKALLARAGVRGLAHIEFKRDPRDGVAKLIECNARFTAVCQLLISAGIDLPAMVHAANCGRTMPTPADYDPACRIMDPLSCVRSYLREPRSLEKGLGWPAFFNFRAKDPLPSIMHVVTQIRRAFNARASKRPRS